MIITLRNFGPIRELSLDLSKDLHLLYGKNGVGKSYAGYAVYILLKNIQKRLQTNAYSHHQKLLLAFLNLEKV